MLDDELPTTGATSARYAQLAPHAAPAEATCVTQPLVVPHPRWPQPVTVGPVSACAHVRGHQEDESLRSECKTAAEYFYESHWSVSSVELCAHEFQGRYQLRGDPVTGQVSLK